jgi:hypothetical protein
MKTIAQHVQDGISTLNDLQDALQTAMQLEFATIPPYLCAQWSINSDPSGVGDMIRNVVIQEMFHFALAGNMLTAIKGTPQIANAGFVPSYPANALPSRYPPEAGSGFAAAVARSAAGFYADRESGISTGCPYGWSAAGHDWRIL